MGNPYLHTIYDAFKMDANGYDTVLEEVNQNWLDATMKWNYLDETRKATTEAIGMWREKNTPKHTQHLSLIHISEPTRPY